MSFGDFFFFQGIGTCHLCYWIYMHWIVCSFSLLSFLKPANSKWYSLFYSWHWWFVSSSFFFFTSQYGYRYLNFIGLFKNIFFFHWLFSIFLFSFSLISIFTIIISFLSLLWVYFAPLLLDAWDGNLDYIFESSFLVFALMSEIFI